MKTKHTWNEIKRLKCKQFKGLIFSVVKTPFEERGIFVGVTVLRLHICNNIANTADNVSPMFKAEMYMYVYAISIGNVTTEARV